MGLPERLFQAACLAQETNHHILPAWVQLRVEVHNIFHLGERWIPKDYYDQFATHIFDLNTEVNYFPSLDNFKVKTFGSNAKTNLEYAITSKSGKTTYGHSLLEHSLENTSTFYKHEIDLGDKTIRIPDNDTMPLAHHKIEAIRNGFTKWLKDLPASDKQYLEELYNNTFNWYVLSKHNGRHLHSPAWINMA